MKTECQPTTNTFKNSSTIMDFIQRAVVAEIGMGLVSLDNLEEVLQTKSENRFVKLWNLTFSSTRKRKN